MVLFLFILNVNVEKIDWKLSEIHFEHYFGMYLNTHPMNAHCYRVL